jgi:pimeloyl-ACP methyl ester carboxylesterase
MILLHGFPDDHRTWDPLIPALATRFRVVTPDLRGYSGSDKPVGVQHYRMERLVGDVIALLDHLRADDAILIGHDWGGAIAQNVALYHPRRVRRLILLNMPHLSGLRRELATNPRQQAASAYARFFQDFVGSGPYDGATFLRQLRGMRHPLLALDVLHRSCVTGLLDYYRANFPRPPYTFVDDAPRRNIKVPTLILFGEDDPYVLIDCVRDNERWFDAPFQFVPVAGAGHWVHHDATHRVLAEILAWL